MLGHHKKKLIACVILLVAITLLYPTLSNHLRATALLLRIENPQTSNTVARLNSHFVAEIPLNDARLYTPIGVANPPGLVIVHGIHHLGIDEPRLVAFARAFAASGVLVLTPELKDLADYRVTPSGIATIGAAAAELHKRTGHPVGVLGLSFAGGLALMTAADSRYSSDISLVVSVGGQDDMARVARFLATGKTVRPDGSDVAMLPHEYGALVLIYSQADRFFLPKDVPAATEAIRLWLYEQPDAARAKAASLSPTGRARLDLLFSKHRESLRNELLADITANEKQMDAVSPHRKLAGIHVPVLLLHGTGDEVIPASESQWLATEIPHEHLRAVLISPAITHVEVGGAPTLRDKLVLVHFMAKIFAELN
jgi:pimeloyl-ACP methyl ester carboxylesterase